MLNSYLYLEDYLELYNKENIELEYSFWNGEIIGEIYLLKSKIFLIIQTNTRN